MTEDDKKKYNYRFSGYLPPLISLGGNTDAGYWCKFYTHPYYVNQPQSWTQPIYQYGAVREYGTIDNNQSDKNASQLHSLLPISN